MIASACIAPRTSRREGSDPPCCSASAMTEPLARNSESPRSFVCPKRSGLNPLKEDVEIERLLQPHVTAGLNSASREFGPAIVFGQHRDEDALGARRHGCPKLPHGLDSLHLNGRQ